MLTGDAKRDYMREYMRRKRAGELTAKPKPEKPEWRPTSQQRQRVREQLRLSPYHRSHVGKAIYDGLGTGDEDEALRRYKAHLDRRNEPAPPAPKRCSFCGEPASEDRLLVTDGRYQFICEPCTKEAAAVFAERRGKK
jgi:formylmethanofuran dehydrogenase subunit E